MIAVTRKVLLVLWMVVGLLGLVDHAAAQLPDAREKESQTLADGGHLGPVIESHGAVFDFDDQELVDADTIYKVVFDVFLTTEPGEMNPAINSAARKRTGCRCSPWPSYAGRGEQ